MSCKFVNVIVAKDFSFVLGREGGCFCFHCSEVLFTVETAFARMGGGSKSQMALQQTQGFCLVCRQPRLFTRQGANNLVHAIVTLFLCGLWIPVWIIANCRSRPFRCSICGQMLSPNVPPAIAPPPLTKAPTVKRPAIGFLTHYCEACGGGIEFPEHGVGTDIPCPHCGVSITL